MPSRSRLRSPFNSCLAPWQPGPGGWDHLGHGSTTALSALNGSVYALNSDNPGILYVGGAFTDAGGNANADNLAKWNGTAWSAVNAAVTLNGAVDAIAYHAGKVYVGGQFTNVGGNVNLDYLAVWNGAHWSSPCNATLNQRAVTAQVAALQIIGNTLYVGGSFGDGAGIAAADYLLACDLTTGAPSATVSHSGDFNAGIYTLAADSNGTLYAGGLFVNVAGIQEADHVAYYSGGTWHAMGSGPSPTFSAIPGVVRSLATNGSSVYVGTDEVDIAGIPKADHVAKWNALTLSYSAMGSNTANTDGWFDGSYAFIDSIATVGSLVFVSGSFQNANGVATADGFAYFNGTAWHPLGSNGFGQGPLNGESHVVQVFNHEIVAAAGQNAGGDLLADDIASYPLLRPDARIGTQPAGPFSGNNIYSASGVGEARTISVVRGQSGIVYADIQNDGLSADALKVTGPSGANGFSLSYFHGAANVTSQVTAGTYSTGSLTPGAHVTLKVVVKVAAGSANSGSFLITARSQPGTPPDTVKVVVNAH